MAEKILVVDDNVHLIQGIQFYLEQEGYQAITASDGQEALRLFDSEHPDLLLLDVMMPVLDGWQVCRHIRETSDVPIIMLTAKTEKEDIVKGLDLGADDYLIKPFDTGELMARVRAALRRNKTKPSTSDNVYRDDYLSIDLDARRVTVNGEPVKLTPTEYKVLDLMVRNKGRTVEFRQIFETIWDFEYVGETGYVHTYIGHLRRKIEPDPRNPRYFLSELDVGYRFEPQR